MKQPFLLLSFVALVLCACETNETIQDPIPLSQTQSPYIITYTATSKLAEVEDESDGIRVGAINASIVGHHFNEGLGVIYFDKAVYWFSYAFQNCKSLTSITIPNSVTSIGGAAFSGCISLTSIDVDAANTHYASVDGVLFNYAKDTLIQYPIGNTRTSYTIPNSVTSIGYSAFYSCDSLTSITIPNSVTSIGDYAFYACDSITSVTIPNSVASIGEHAFSWCTSLTSITIPNSVTSIGNGAFLYCISLTSVTIPNSVTSIGYGAFYGCTSLTSITCYATTPPICEGGCFYEVDQSIPLYVPKNSITAYQQADEWKSFTNIQAIID